MSATSYSAGRDDWMDHALCWWLTSDEFHTEHRGGSAWAAKRACELCPVRAECLAYAMRVETGTREGIYGGFSPREREALHRRGWKAGDPIPPVRYRSAA